MGFDDIYKPGKRTSPQLGPLLRELHDATTSTELSLARVKQALVQLFSLLASPEGRTHANCDAADQFIYWGDDWKPAWGEVLPDPYIDILGCGALHDTVSAPSVAENFGCTPEQLLAKARALPT